MRIVVDTNVIISAIFFGGKPKLLTDIILMGNVDAFVTDEIIKEYYETASSFSKGYIEKEDTSSLDMIVSTMVEFKGWSQIQVCRDRDDDKFLNCAVDSKSQYIVSGDKDLLCLKRIRDIEIITVSEFLEIYDNRYRN